MALQEQFLIKTNTLTTTTLKILLRVFGVVVLLFGGCENSPKIILSIDPELDASGSIVLFQQKPFSGAVVQLTGNGDSLAYTTYAEGRKEGLAKNWWPNGQLKSQRNFSKGDFDGILLEWFEDGKLYKKCLYKAGKEAGLQQCWNKDGSFKFNYVAKNGRKYGLTGIKNCNNDAKLVEQQ